MSEGECFVSFYMNFFRRRKRALLWELSQMAKNAIWFNEEDSLIVKHACTGPCPDSVEIYRVSYWSGWEGPGGVVFYHHLYAL